MGTKPLYTTINTGKYKGKKLELPSLESTRSTKAILKGSLFDTLQYDVMDTTFVEVFGGSGSIGLEALSRGAMYAYFIEKDQDAVRILKRNCKVIDDTHTTVIYGDSFTVLPTLFSALRTPTYFYFDPPFSIREGMEEVYQNTLRLIASLPQDKTIAAIVEHMSTEVLPETIGSYTLQKTKKFGKSSLSYYR
ncbi:16S rRNA (guanine(966)-N(2))-methyltransferase RsmD [Sulfurospirillum cavolei]|uniref:16S rRNA (guanine(966)-N(2))-methyltransferase RsmD n=1 Tax=Sulfurospirillum cavolei TaxID=366522 RepID=UPI000764A804|nr:16S rRNA (guanine(966)-N(2))-methyltransferase RsmD [Sulfurospirillum cavolei]